MSSPSSLQTKTKKWKKKMMASSSSQAKENSFKKNNREKKMQRKEGAYLFSLASTFGMKHSSCLPLSTFLQPWAVHLPQALCPTSPRSSMLLKLRSSPELWRWSEQEMKWERYEGKILGQRRGLKNPWAGEEDGVFGSSPKQLERPHPELVHWWLLVHSNPVKALRENERGDITQFTTKIGGKTSLGSQLFCFLKFHSQLSIWWPIMPFLTLNCLTWQITLMYCAHPNSSQAPHQAKTALYLTHSIIPNVFTKGKGREEKHQQQTTPECSHSCNWICAFCVSWNEWVVPSCVVST